MFLKNCEHSLSNIVEVGDSILRPLKKRYIAFIKTFANKKSYIFFVKGRLGFYLH